jgi:hypothetical protein
VQNLLVQSTVEVEVDRTVHRAAARVVEQGAEADQARSLVFDEYARATAAI